jgi:hypothetical protein
MATKPLPFIAESHIGVTVGGDHLGNPGSDAYGFDVRAWPRVEELLQVRELLDCSFALTMCGLDPRAPDELAIRVRSFRNAKDRSAWTPL